MKLIHSEFFPFASLVLLLQQTSPGLRLRIPGEGIVKRAVGILEDKLDAISCASAIAECFGNPSAKDINPVREVTLAGIIIADENHRLVVWRRGEVLHVNAQELVLQDPFCLHGIFSGLAANFARELPFAHQMIQQFVVENAIPPIQRPLRCDGHPS